MPLPKAAQLRSYAHARHITTIKINRYTARDVELPCFGDFTAYPFNNKLAFKPSRPNLPQLAWPKIAATTAAIKAIKRTAPTSLALQLLGSFLSSS